MPFLPIPKSSSQSNRTREENHCARLQSSSHADLKLIHEAVYHRKSYWIELPEVTDAEGWLHTRDIGLWRLALVRCHCCNIVGWFHRCLRAGGLTVAPVFRSLLNVKVEISAEEFERALIAPNSYLAEIHMQLLRVRNLRDHEVGELEQPLCCLESVRLGDVGDDFRVWVADPSRSFSCKSLSSLCSISVSPFPWFKSIWNTPVPKKVQISLCKAVSLIGNYSSPSSAIVRKFYKNIEWKIVN
ncbi:hypothetical protein ACS0TY_034665 [Phlomoides rotata]